MGFNLKEAKWLAETGIHSKELSVLGTIWGPSWTSGDHLGPLGTIWGPSEDHYSKKLSTLVILDQKYFFTQNALSKI